MIYLTYAGVVKLADALDSKSCGLIIRVGSSPTTGTITGVYETPRLRNRVFGFFFFCAV